MNIPPLSDYNKYGKNSINKIDKINEYKEYKEKVFCYPGISKATYSIDLPIDELSKLPKLELVCSTDKEPKLSQINPAEFGSLSDSLSDEASWRDFIDYLEEEKSAEERAKQLEELRKAEQELRDSVQKLEEALREEEERKQLIIQEAISEIEETLDFCLCDDPDELDDPDDPD